MMSKLLIIQITITIFNNERLPTLSPLIKRYIKKLNATRFEPALSCKPSKRYDHWAMRSSFNSKKYNILPVVIGFANFI